MAQLPENLVQLSLANNAISRLVKEDFAMCKHSLKILNLSRNRLVSTKGLAVCVGIKDLNLSGNQICDEELSISISGIKRLRRLDISQNCLKSGGILSNTITSLRGLKILRAGQNTLHGTFFIDVSRHGKLKEIYLS